MQQEGLNGFLKALTFINKNEESLKGHINKLEVDDYELPEATSNYDEPPEANTNEPPEASTNDTPGATTSDAAGEQVLINRCSHKYEMFWVKLSHEILVRKMDKMKKIERNLLKNS
ncbi:hypothetical protein C2G38_2044796 [Gigaspora rosea]|uniref:Uncharacterized protein n=1 Tax=Gigaspora rosea TaxID=44941 RepID=A0A397UF00_9GLOM|nr:hypothetical protein C2G38_2044796 [Gigaspora rosea]